MANTPSIATNDPKKIVCATGAVLIALLSPFKLPPSNIQDPNNNGKVARTANVKTKLIIFGGAFCSARKMWWISGFAA